MIATKRTLILLLVAFSISLNLSATHNRAGEIIYNQIDDRTIECLLITYTESTALSADRNSLELSWGDGQKETLLRVNGPDVNGDNIPDGEILDNSYKKNIYQGTHTYADFGQYTLGMEDPNRNEDVLNVDPFGSGFYLFYIETEVFLSAEINHSPVLLQAPIDVGMVGQPFIHIPNAFDIDGDSIAYQMVIPLMGPGLTVPNYSPLTEVLPGPNNQLSFDQTTGLLIWETPQMAGAYTIAIEVSTFRKGILNGKVIRDMEILILPDENELPEIVFNPTMMDTTILVDPGDQIDLSVFADDQDNGQIIKISSTSGLYEYFLTPAIFEFIDNSTNFGSATFSWTVGEEHVRKQPYPVVFKASDDLGLANFLLIRFRVNGIIDGLSKIPEEVAIEVYPNPTSDKVWVKKEKAASENFSLWNARGQWMRSGKYNAREGISVQNLPAGMYFLQLDQETIIRFIKN